MPIRFRIPLIVGLLFLGGYFGALGDAATLYVATNGSDSNSGSQSAPFKTIAKGLSVLNPGGTLIIASGNYPEIISNIPSGSSDSARTQIQGSGASCNGIDIYSKNFITVTGLTFNGYPNHIGRQSTSNALSTNITFQNTVSQGWAGGGSGGGGVNVGFRQEGFSSFIRLINHTSRNNGSTKLDHGIYVQSRDITIQGGAYYGNAGHGIHVFSSAGAGSTNNTSIQGVNSHDNGSFGIGLYSGTSLSAIGNTISNNGKTVAGSGQLRIAYGSVGAIVKDNNICGYNPIVDDGVSTQQSNNTCGGVVIPAPGNVTVGTNNPPQQESPTPAPSGGGSSIPVAGIIGAGVLIAVLMSD